MLHQRIRAALFLSVIARALLEYPAFVVMAPVFMMACAAFALTILFFFPGYLTRDASFVHSYAQEWYLGDWQSPLMTILWRLIDPISPGSGSIFLLIATLYWLSFALIAGAVARRSAGRAIVVLLLALAPPAFCTPRLAWSWLRAVAVHPLAYLRHRLTFLSTFLAGANLTLELERLKFVDQVPLARNRYFMAIAALHDALRSTPLFHKGPWLALATAVAVLAWRGRASPPGTFAISLAASGIVYILSFG